MWILPHRIILSRDLTRFVIIVSSNLVGTHALYVIPFLKKENHKSGTSSLPVLLFDKPNSPCYYYIVIFLHWLPFCSLHGLVQLFTTHISSLPPSLPFMTITEPSVSPENRDYNMEVCPTFPCLSLPKGLSLFPYFSAVLED